MLKSRRCGNECLRCWVNLLKHTNKQCKAFVKRGNTNVSSYHWVTTASDNEDDSEVTDSYEPKNQKILIKTRKFEKDLQESSLWKKYRRLMGSEKLKLLFDKYQEKLDHFPNKHDIDWFFSIELFNGKQYDYQKTWKKLY
jgi:hypothetical protein